MGTGFSLQGRANCLKKLICVEGMSTRYIYLASVMALDSPSSAVSFAHLKSSMCSNPARSWLPHAAEATLEGLALRVNEKENAAVLADLPHSAQFEINKVVLANVGSTTTQVYDTLTGECLAMLQGGFKTWTETDEAELLAALERFAANPDEPEGELLPVCVAIVGAPGYAVVSDEKWHAVASVDAPLCKFLAKLETQHHGFHMAILNRRPECGFQQPNCDWGSAYAALPLEAAKAAWPEGPREEDTNAVIVDLGGGYSRAYRPDGVKIQEWATEFRPNIKANDFLFDGKVFYPERLGKLEGVYKEALSNLAADLPGLRGETGVMDVYIIGTGKARNAMLKTI